MGHYKNIAIIESDEEVIELYGVTLNELSNDINVHAYHSAADFLNKVSVLNNAIPDIILCEINLNGLNGFNALKIFKTHTIIKDIPVIMHTNSRSKSDIDTAYQLGASRYFIKPFSFTSLKSSLYQLFFDNENITSNSIMLTNNMASNFVMT